MKNNIRKIIEGLEACKQTGTDSYIAKCPCHADKKPSLSITAKEDKILLHCFAGCKTEDIVNKLGLNMQDLFQEKKEESKILKIVAEYVYRDENNNPLYKVVRFYPKSFTQAKYVNGEWVFKMNDVRYVLYNLQNVMNSDVIYFVEGEKDADNLNKIGLVATTTIGGASGFNKHKEEYIKFLENKKVYIIPDNDITGNKYAQNVYKALKGISKDVKILNLANKVMDLKEKEDISDVLNRYGKEKTIDILEELKESFDISMYIKQHINLDMLKNILKEMGITIKYNEITKEAEIKGLPSKYSSESAEDILPAIISDICINNDIRYTDKDIRNEILLLSDSNRYNPVKEMLTMNKWDGTDRFPVLFEIMGISNDAFSKILVRKWFQQTTMIVFNNSEKPYGIDGVLVLQGKQGCRKNKAY